MEYRSKQRIFPVLPARHARVMEAQTCGSAQPMTSPIGACSSYERESDPQLHGWPGTRRKTAQRPRIELNMTRKKRKRKKSQ